MLLCCDVYNVCCEMICMDHNLIICRLKKNEWWFYIISFCCGIYWDCVEEMWGWNCAHRLSHIPGPDLSWVFWADTSLLRYAWWHGRGQYPEVIANLGRVTKTEGLIHVHGEIRRSRMDEWGWVNVMVIMYGYLIIAILLILYYYCYQTCFSDL